MNKHKATNVPAILLFNKEKMKMGRQIYKIGVSSELFWRKFIFEQFMGAT